MRIYYGWYVVAIAILIYTVLVGTIFVAYGVYVLPVSAEFKLSRAEMNTGMSLIILGDAILAPVIGRMLDRLPIRSVIITGAIAFIIGMVTLGTSHMLWLNAFILSVVIPIAYLGSGTITNTVLIARWFTAQRGRAMVLTGVGISLGTLIAPPIVGSLVDIYGWRTVLMVVGVAIGGLLLCLGLILRERPGPDDIESPGPATTASHAAAEPSGTPIKVLTLLGNGYFWVVTLCAAAVLAQFQTLVITLVPFGKGHGLTTLEATSLLSIMGTSAIVGGVLVSSVADRFDRAILLTGLFVVAVAMNGTFLIADNYMELAIAAVLLGFGSATVTHTLYALLADRFGTPSFGTVRGISLVIISLVSVVIIRFGGEIFDRTGSYNAMFIIFGGLALTSAVVTFATRLTRAALAARSTAAVS
jgi:MFS family permease